MLTNPFTPSDIAAGPDQFFGRGSELTAIETSLPLGSTLIQGPIGIGKSSLLARALDLMAGAGCDTRVVVANSEVETAESAARLVLDSLIDANESDGKFRLKFGIKLFGGVEPNIEVESKDAAKDLREGRPLAALKRILEKDYKRRRASNRKLLILGIDEADKAPTAMTRLVRSIWTHCQQVGVPDVRFAFAGVSPLHQEMVAEDQGVERAFNRVLTLTPMSREETREMLLTKFTAVLSDAKTRGFNLTIVPDVVDRIVSLSGGHPHIVQLLGSHIIQHEQANPDGVLDANDLLGVLQRICYQDRKATYAATLHLLENAGKLGSLSSLLTTNLVREGFPTKIDRQGAVEAVGLADIQWFVEHDVLAPRSANDYGLVDEFLRVRLAFDGEKPERRDEIEQELVRKGHIVPWDEVKEAYYLRGEDIRDEESLEDEEGDQVTHEDQYEEEEEET